MLNREFKIAARPVGESHSPYVIAEVGSNFNQSLDVARRLIDVASQAGADAVKFQLFRADKLYPDGGKMHDIFKSIELDAEWVPRLMEEARSRGLQFFASAFDSDSVKSLAAAGVPAIKVASSETTNLPLLRQMAAVGVPVILSTGMCDSVDVEEAVAICEAAGNHDVALLQCGAMYPLPQELVNLRVMNGFTRRFACPVGYSDHTLGVLAGAVAVGAGAVVLEKHFTLDRKMDGPDHFYALEPAELKAYIESVRQAHAMLGDGIKDLLPEERKVGRRDGLHATADLDSGQVLTLKDIEVRRPATGIRARHLGAVVGARLKTKVGKGEPLRWEDIRVDS